MKRSLEGFDSLLAAQAGIRQKASKMGLSCPLPDKNLT
jgi:hypothetical protein